MSTSTFQPVSTRPLLPPSKGLAMKTVLTSKTFIVMGFLALFAMSVVVLCDSDMHFEHTMTLAYS